jgi:DNA-binding MarR family transcriptional regulator
LKAELNITDGNLDAHLRKLSAAGYLHSQIVLDGRPHTIYQLSDSGKKAFRRYRKTLRQLIEQSGR